MNWMKGASAASGADFYKEEDFTAAEYHLLRMLKEKNRNLLLDELSWISGMPVSQTASVLLSLEFKGAVQALPGKLYALKPPKS